MNTQSITEQIRNLPCDCALPPHSAERAYATGGFERALEFAAALVAPLETSHGELLAALQQITDLKEGEYQMPVDWSEQIAACPECQGWAKNHPIQQGICDEHRRPLWARERHNKDETAAFGYRMKHIARAAIANAEKLNTKQP